MKMKKMPKHKRLISLVCMVFGLLLVVCALVLTEYNIWDDLRAGRLIDEVVEEIEKGREEENYEIVPQMEMPTKKIKGYMYVGTLTVPYLDLELPVMDRCDDERLKISPCRYTGSVYLNNMIIAAHNYRSHFGRLRNLTVGDEVRFEDVDGNVFCYVVAETELLEPTAVYHMESGSWDLTLFTCTVGGASRVTVRCTLVEEK